MGQSGLADATDRLRKSKKASQGRRDRQGCRGPGTESRFMLHIQYISDIFVTISEAKNLKIKAMTRRLFKGRSSMTHHNCSRKSGRTVLS